MVKWPKLRLFRPKPVSSEWKSLQRLSFLLSPNSREVIEFTVFQQFASVSFLSIFVGVLPRSDPPFSHKRYRRAMASDDAGNSSNQPSATPKLQIYSTSSTGVSPFWKGLYPHSSSLYYEFSYPKYQICLQLRSFWQRSTREKLKGIGISSTSGTRIRSVLFSNLIVLAVLMMND